MTTPNYVPAGEQQQYEVPGRQMRWRAAQLAAQGLEYHADYMPQRNAYVINIYNVTPGADPFAYQPPPHPRQAWPAFDPASLTRWLGVLLMVGLLGGTLYMAFARAESEPQAQAEPEREDVGPLAWLAGLLPWGDDAPVQAAAKPAPEPFRWPWERAAAAMQGAVDGVTMVLLGVLGGIVLLIVLALMSKWRRR